MDKIIGILLVIVIFLTGMYTIPYCISWITDVSQSNGELTTASKSELTDDILGYTITYELNGGILTSANPETYTLFTNTFTLNNPTKEGYAFLGWTGSNGDVPKITITIGKGSAGNLEFNANFALILETPALTQNANIVSWNEIPNATGYKININGTDVSTTSSLEFNLREAKNYLIEGNNIVKVKAYAESTLEYADGPYSNSIIYSVSKLESPVVTSDMFNISWNSIEGASKYIVSIGAYTIETEETTINLLNHLDLLSAVGTTTVRVQAVALAGTDYINSNFSTAYEYSRPKLGSVTLTLNDSILSWTYLDVAESYEIYVNTVKVLTVTGKSEIDVKELNSYCNDGENAIYIKALATGYNSVISNSILYSYYDLNAFEDLTLNMQFSRTSSGYILKVVGNVVVVYNYNGTLETGYADSAVYDENLSLEENFLLVLNPQQSSSELKLLNCTMFELAEYINAQYLEGTNEAYLDVTNKFYFVVKDQFNTEYIPENIQLLVTYGTMFNEVPFYENCSAPIVSFDTWNNASIDYHGWSDTPLFSTCIDLKDINGNQYRITYQKYTKTSEEGFRIQEWTNDKEGDFYTESEFNELLKDVKFYLNCEYYYTIKTDFSTFIKQLYAEAISKRGQNEWAYTTINYTMLVNDYFNVYTTAGTLVEFNYSLILNYATGRSI